MILRVAVMSQTSPRLLARSYQIPPVIRQVLRRFGAIRTTEGNAAQPPVSNMSLNPKLALLAGAALVCATTAATAQEGGEIPNRSYTPDQEGTLLPQFSMGEGYDHNQPSIVNGYLLLAGNGTFHVWDISDPFNPEGVSFFESEFNVDEAESHSIAYAQTGDGRTLCVTISGRGVDLWDLTDIENPEHLSHMMLEGVDYGDNTNAVWGVFWQGDYIYVGGTDTGIHVVDATDPRDPSLVVRVPTAEMGGVSAGPLYAVGNLLVVTTPKNHRGVATLDISDPAAPSVLDFIIPEEDSYIGAFFGRNAYLVDPLRTFDVTTDPSNIEMIGYAETPDSEYMSFGDGMLFLGSLRPNPGNYIHDISDPNNPVQLQYVEGRKDDFLEGLFTDDQFSLPVGNLLILSDDEINIGSTIAVWDAEPDSTPPEVAYINPPDGATSQALTSRIGISFTDQVDLRSVTAESLIVRPVGGGDALTGMWGHLQTVISFWPDEPLEPNTTYEIVLPAGGVTDLVGNALPDEFRSVFSTGEDLPAITCDPGPTTPVPVGEAATFAATEVAGATYTWDFGDGSPVVDAPDAAQTHSYDDPGRYIITLTVEAEGTARSCTGVQIVHRPLGSLTPERSGTVAVDGANDRVWVVNRDAGTVAAISLTDMLVTDEVATGADPRSVALAPSGALWVVSQLDDTITVIDSGAMQVSTTVDVGYGAAPYGVAFEPDGDRAFVTLEQTGELLVLDADGVELDRISLAPDRPYPPTVRGLAAAGDGRVLVTQWISAPDGGIVFDVNVDTGEVNPIVLASSPGPDTTTDGRGVPNGLGSVALSPDGTSAWIPATKSNIERGEYLDGQPLNTTNTVRTIVARVDLDSGSEDPSERVDFDDHDSAVAVEISPLGDLVFVASRGTNRVDVIDAYSGDLVSGFSTPLGPDGLVLDEDGRLWVHCFTSRTLAVYDVSGILAGTDTSTRRLAEIQTVANEPLTDAELLGLQIFYNGNSPEMSQDGYISCGSCHTDGAHDGMVWDFTDRGEGLRNTIDLRGRAGTGHGPVHWTGNFDEIHDFENDIRLAFGGGGLMTDEEFMAEDRSDPLGGAKEGVSARLDALAAYVATFDTFPRSPYRDDSGQMTEEAERGLQVFVQQDCLDCHSGDALTDSAVGVLHDVGTSTDASGGRRGEALPGFDTPTLRGLWMSPPYLHDGSAETLEDVLRVPGHGDAQDLSAEDMAALVAFLLQIENEVIDFDAVDVPSDDVGADVGIDSGSDAANDTGNASNGSGGGGGCSTSGSPRASILWVLAVGACLIGRRRR